MTLRSVDHCRSKMYDTRYNAAPREIRRRDGARGVTQPSGAPVTVLGQGPSPLI